MADSRSCLVTAFVHELRGMHDDMDALVDDLGLTWERTIELPHVTTAFRAVRS